jgi:primosomal protein N' (replication factor Y)
MIAHVALPLPIDKIFSYALPAPLDRFVRPLTRVKVPFRNRSLVGFVLATGDGGEDGLKPVQGLVDYLPLIDETCLDLCTWASRHYVTPIGLVLRYALSTAIKMEKYCVVRTREPAVAHLNDLRLRKARSERRHGAASRLPRRIGDRACRHL